MRTVAFRAGQHHHLGALAGDVAGAHHARRRDVRDEPDPDGISWRQVTTEGASEQHLLNILLFDTELLQQDGPPGRNSRLGKLQLPYVTLGQIDARARDRISTKNEDPLLTAHHQPVGHVRGQLHGAFIRNEATRLIDQSHAHEFGDGIHQPGSADTRGLDVIDHFHLDAGLVDPNDFNRSTGRTHAAGNRRGFERRTRRCCCRQQSVSVAEDHFAVGADVDEQPNALIAIHAARQGTGDDVATHVGPQGGEQAGARSGVDLDAEFASPHVWVILGRENERSDTERFGVDTQSDLNHRGVSGHRYLIHLVSMDPRFRTDLVRELIEGLVGQGLKGFQRRRVQHGGADPADHIGAIPLLFVEHRRDGQRHSIRQVHQRCHHAGGSEVVCDRKNAIAGVSRFDSNQDVVDDDHGHREVGRSKNLRQPPQYPRIRIGCDIGDGIHDATKVRPLIGEGWLG